MKGRPTYEPTDYAVVVSTQKAQRMCKLLITGGIFFACEPMPDDLWYFYVKEEAAGMAQILADTANMEGQTPL